jgi:hypothetical protein
MTSNLPVHPVTDDPSWTQVVRQARCADSNLDPDEWFPASIDPARARHEAAAAIAICISCLVRTQCLELSLRYWDIGQHGVWGGLIAADRARLRHRLPADHRGPQHHRRFRNDHAAVIGPVPWPVGGAGDVQ